MPEALSTPRLLLRPLQLSDAARTQELFPKWEIVRLLNAVVPWPYPPDGALVYFRDHALPAMERGDEWHWTIRLREDSENHIGVIGLFRGERDNRGFWMGLPWQGRGLMTEAVIGVNHYWFDVLGFEVLRTRKAASNYASSRISEKTGMRLVETTMGNYVAGPLLEEVWEITAEVWHAKCEGVLETLRLGRH